MQRRIPKVIHYCWFGGKKLPKSARDCISSWKRVFPDYEIKEWNESNFDVNIIPYTAAAYADKKYAFVSDYARFWILYKYGGVYFDTDVKALRPIDDIVEKGPFMGREDKLSEQNEGYGVAPGLGIACEAGNPFYAKVLETYASTKYGEVKENGRPVNVVDIVTEVFKPYGLIQKNIYQECAGIAIYPSDYFCPRPPFEDKSKPVVITENTRTVHLYAGTWLPRSVRIKNKIGDLIGEKWLIRIVKIKKLLKD